MKAKYLMRVASLAMLMLAGFSAAADPSSFMQPPRFGEDSVACVRNWSLYDQYYKQGNYEMAIAPWREMFLNCPLATQNIYVHGVVLVRYMHQNETDPARRDALVDTLMMVYDQRIEAFGREGFVLGRKVVDLFRFRPNEVQQHFDISERSIELEGNNTLADALVINFQSTVRLAEAGLIEIDKVVRNYDRATDIIEYNLEHNPRNQAFFEQAKSNIEALFEPYTTCENLITIFQPRYEADPTNVELLRRITDMLDQSGCTREELFYEATLALHLIEPDAQSAFLLGRLESAADNDTAALEFYSQAIALYEEEPENNHAEQLYRIHMLMADIYHRNLRQFPQARTHALRAAEAKSDEGRPFLLIGEMYAASASDCGDDEFTKKTAYWPAVDMFERARRVDDDPVVQERATQLINTFSQYFPNIELIFFYGFDPGDTYRVECWINETTRVRPR